MGDALQNGAIEKEDSISLLYDSLAVAKRSQMDELTEFRFLVGKLAEVRTKYANYCLSMADEFDIMEAKNAAENAAKQGESEAKLKKLQDNIQSYVTELKSQIAEKDTVNQYNRLVNDFLVSIHDQFRNFFAQINAREEVVTIGSATEDDVSDHEQNDEELQEEQAEAAESSTGITELVQNDHSAHETEQVQQNLSNGDAHEETTMPNVDQGKENVRPERTSVAKDDTIAVTPVVSSASTGSIIVTVPKVSVAPKAPLIEQVAQNVDDPGTSGILQPKKQYDCMYCDEVFTEKSLVFQHWKQDHGIQKVPYNIRKVVKRKRTMVDNKADDEKVDDNNVIEILPKKNGRYVTLHSNPMKQAVKRQKKSSAKIYYIASD